MEIDKAIKKLKHSSRSSQCTSPKHPVSCIEPGLATRFIHDILHVSMHWDDLEGWNGEGGGFKNKIKLKKKIKALVPKQNITILS